VKHAANWARLNCHDFADRQVRLSAYGGFALAYNLGSFLRWLALPASVKHWTLTTRRKKLIKIGAKGGHTRYVTFQTAESEFWPHAGSAGQENPNGQETRHPGTDFANGNGRLEVNCGLTGWPTCGRGGN